MNYAIVYLGGILAFALLYWIIHGRKFYTGPLIEAEVQIDDNSDDFRQPQKENGNGSDTSNHGDEKV
jgi:hypothetical protein